MRSCVRRGLNKKAASELLIEAIVDANPAKENGPTRAQRIDRAEALLLGRPPRRGVDQFDDDEILRRVAKRYFEQWREYPDREIEVAPIAKSVLDEVELRRKAKPHPGNGSSRKPPEHDLNSAVRRIVRKFNRDRDRLLASVTHDPQWDPPEVYLDLLSVIDTLKRLGANANPDTVRSRLRRKEWSESPANESGAKAGE